MYENMFFLIYIQTYYAILEINGVSKNVSITQNSNCDIQSCNSTYFFMSEMFIKFFMLIYVYFSYFCFYIKY